MKRPTRLLIASGILASAASLCAQAERSVEVTSPDGNVTKAPLTLATRIAFGTDGIDITNDGMPTVSVQYAAISNISFGQDTGVSAIREDGLRILGNPVADLLRIAGFQGQHATLTIAAINGTSMLSINQWKGEDIDVSHLNPGIYILTIDSNTIKFIKK